ncbi:hypothetical protein B296_00008178 [Ensete ventricosum]|uniref:Uncharacterized protein n=1 Tax=Ensete ventricosum TaxID=4639 RepID=A0A427BBD2_ENSVE|nr:hypothetical protein B296_00008178 [Ensete ventricosum]
MPLNTGCRVSRNLVRPARRLGGAEDTVAYDISSSDAADLRANGEFVESLLKFSIPSRFSSSSPVAAAAAAADDAGAVVHAARCSAAVQNQKPDPDSALSKAVGLAFRSPSQVLNAVILFIRVHHEEPLLQESGGGPREGTHLFRHAYDPTV